MFQLGNNDTHAIPSQDYIRYISTMPPLDRSTHVNSPQLISWCALAANPDARVLGARHGGRLAGAACGFLCPDIVGACRPFLVVENVVVAPAWRLLGIGRLLMDALEAWGRERGCSYAILVSGPARREAHAFYAALGYEACAGFKKRLAGCGA